VHFSFEVGIVGARGVRLVMAACLAHVGHGVGCIDRDQARVGALSGGQVAFYQPYVSWNSSKS
jgi:UDP-glucose 6-dehydrogenase